MVYTQVTSLIPTGYAFSRWGTFCEIDVVTSSSTGNPEAIPDIYMSADLASIMVSRDRLKWAISSFQQYGYYIYLILLQKSGVDIWCNLVGMCLLN